MADMNQDDDPKQDKDNTTPGNQDRSSDGYFSGMDIATQRPAFRRFPEAKMMPDDKPVGETEGTGSGGVQHDGTAPHSSSGYHGRMDSRLGKKPGDE